MEFGLKVTTEQEGLGRLSEGMRLNRGIGKKLTRLFSRAIRFPPKEGYAREIVPGFVLSLSVDCPFHDTY